MSWVAGYKALRRNREIERLNTVLRTILGCLVRWWVAGSTNNTNMMLTCWGVGTGAKIFPLVALGTVLDPDTKVQAAVVIAVMFDL